MLIDLTHDEALVLFETLARVNKTNYENLFEDQSERTVLQNIESQLEKILVEPFDSDYLSVLEGARNRIKESSNI